MLVVTNRGSNAYPNAPNRPTEGSGIGVGPLVKEGGLLGHFCARPIDQKARLGHHPIPPKSAAVSSSGGGVLPQTFATGAHPQFLHPAVDVRPTVPVFGSGRFLRRSARSRESGSVGRSSDVLGP